MTTNELFLEHTESKFVVFSENKLPINFKHLFGLKIIDEIHKF